MAKRKGPTIKALAGDTFEEVGLFVQSARAVKRRAREARVRKKRRARGLTLRERIVKARRHREWRRRLPEGARKAEAKAAWEKLKANPVRHAEVKARNSERTKKRRAEDPEYRARRNAQLKEAQQRARAKDDPEKREAKRRRQREWWALNKPVRRKGTVPPGGSDEVGSGEKEN